MRRIFISTNYSQLYNVIDTLRKQFEALKSEPFIAILDENIVLFNDTEIKCLPNSMEINQTSDYLLYHQRTADKIIEKFSSKTNGRHENVIGAKYKEVFEILLDAENNKTERILEYLFSETLENNLKKLDDIAKGNEEFEVEGKMVKYDNENSSHCVALANLRDELLKD